MFCDSNMVSFWSGCWDKSGHIYVALSLNVILNLPYGLINCYLTCNMNYHQFLWLCEVLWSDICLKSEKPEVIKWQPENCKDKF